MINKLLIFICTTILFSCSANIEEKKGKKVNDTKRKFGLVIHGGAGNITKENLTEERWLIYKNVLDSAVNLGYSFLENGMSSTDVVQRVIEILENDSNFNAGRGSVYNHVGIQEMDASIMEGKTLNSGAVAGVNQIKNPIKAAYAVLDKSPHVLLSGEGAKIFAKEQQLEIVDSSYFFVKKRYDYWKKLKDKEKLELDHNQKIAVTKSKNHWENTKFGTVGAVVIDKNGNISAGTSTGGMTNKKYGRIGDSPIIGAGTYADNNSVGVSCTGSGEYFIRSMAAYEVSALVKYKNQTLQQALDNSLKNVKNLGGSGGMIALDNLGNISTSFNTKGMFRAFKSSDGSFGVEAFAKK